MARRQVVEVQCSRCERTETREFDAAVKEVTPQFTAKLVVTEGAARTVEFEDLCGPCMRSIRALLDQAGKKIEGVSPDRAAAPKDKKKEPAEQASKPAPHAPTHASADKKPVVARSS
jgi:hypothetical protein